MAMTINYREPLIPQSGLTLTEIAGNLEADTYIVKIVSCDAVGSGLGSYYAHSPTIEQTIVLSGTAGIQMDWVNEDPKHLNTHIYIKKGSGNMLLYKVANGYNGWSGSPGADSYDMINYYAYGNYPFIENITKISNNFNLTMGQGVIEVTGSSGTIYPVDMRDAMHQKVGYNQFTGSGLNDMTCGGTFSGSAFIDYLVEIDATGTPDTFKWSDDGGATYTTGVSITGSAQTLSNGVTVTFAATTGHTLADVWQFRAGFHDRVYYDEDRYFATLEGLYSGTTTGGTFNISKQSCLFVNGFFNSNTGMEVYSTMDYKAMAELGTCCAQGGNSRFAPGKTNLEGAFLGELNSAFTGLYGVGIGGQQVFPGYNATFTKSWISSYYSYIPYYDTFSDCIFTSVVNTDWVNDAVNPVMNVTVLRYYFKVYYGNGRNSIYRNLVVNGTSPYDIQSISFVNYQATYVNYKHIYIDAQFPRRSDNLPIIYWINDYNMNPFEFKNSVNIKVLDENNNGIENATVVMTDKNGDEVFSTTTDSNGAITEQFLIRATMTHTPGSGSGTGDDYTTTVDFNPFTVTVSKSGYKLHEGVHSISDKVDWQIVLKQNKVLNLSNNINISE